MTISYKWLSEYLPVELEPERLSKILTSIGLEVEKMEAFEEVKGGLKGLVIGEVLEVQPHPNADKLRLTRVNTGSGEPLQIVCGAPNVAAGQKVVVATVGTTIYPSTGDPMTMKLAKIRGMESYGMICAEDEIGLGDSHAGIMVLPADAPVGMPASDYFKPFDDITYEIGLTPNRMDAMSHWGVARDVCAYLSHHDKKDLKPKFPHQAFKIDSATLPINAGIEAAEACRRYSGVCIAGVTVGESPEWLQQKLKAIGLRPINNIVDITNFIQHETGQPLHAFDYDKISDKTIIVKLAKEGSAFVTLDEKERKLAATDLMIADTEKDLCIAGVFGGLGSGVTATTKNIFLESAWFDPIYIRKTSFRHGLRTDAATRFEKGIDISNTVTVAKRAALLIKEIAGGTIASDIIDIYPDPVPKTEVTLRFHYLKKLSGKSYHPDAVKAILQSLGFELVRESVDAVVVAVPYHKPDVSLPADLVEEILRIDGLDNIEIPTTISISPSVEADRKPELLREKTATVLTGMGFSEILTNSITNSAYFSDTELQHAVKLLNNLSNELNIMRPSMLHTALEVISFNLNRKNNQLRFFEWGKTYSTSGAGSYHEVNHLCLYLTGNTRSQQWQEKGREADFFYMKGVVEAILANLGLKDLASEPVQTNELQQGLSFSSGGETILNFGLVSSKLNSLFDIKQPVYFADFNWDAVLKLAGKSVQFREIPKFPAVQRDLALVVARSTPFSDIRERINKLKLAQLKELRLFDLFESEKLGADKKSLAVNLTFLDEEKTLTDKEIDSWMNKIMATLEKDLQAEIRK